MSKDGAPNQAMEPSGLMGSVFGWLMAGMNAKAYRWTLDQLRPAPPASFLEIGFGTGHLLELVAKTYRPRVLAGVDPSALMVEQAGRRVRRFRRRTELDIRQGDDKELPAGPFDAVAALHAFQFWTDPLMTLRNIRARLSPGGRMILVLRLHGRHPPKWVPNPLTHKKDEVSAAVEAATAAGFQMIGMQRISRTSQGIVFTAQH
jgi:SAM-dependent methyltransferase